MATLSYQPHNNLALISLFVYTSQDCRLCLIKFRTILLVAKLIKSVEFLHCLVVTDVHLMRHCFLRFTVLVASLIVADVCVQSGWLLSVYDVLQLVNESLRIITALID